MKFCILRKTTTVSILLHKWDGVNLKMKILGSLVETKTPVFRSFRFTIRIFLKKALQRSFQNLWRRRSKNHIADRYGDQSTDSVLSGNFRSTS